MRLFRDSFLECAQMGNLSECYIFQLVGTTLAIMAMAIQIPLVPNLKPLCEEVVTVAFICSSRLMLSMPEFMKNKLKVLGDLCGSIGCNELNLGQTLRTDGLSA